MRRAEVVELYADGSRIVARCTLCGGQLSRGAQLAVTLAAQVAPASGWNLWDLLDAMGQHVDANH